MHDFYPFKLAGIAWRLWYGATFPLLPDSPYKIFQKFPSCAHKYRVYTSFLEHTGSCLPKQLLPLCISSSLSYLKCVYQPRYTFRIHIRNPMSISSSRSYKKREHMTWLFASGMIFFLIISFFCWKLLRFVCFIQFSTVVHFHIYLSPYSEI